VPANLPSFCEAFLVDYSQERFQAMNKGAAGGSGYGSWSVWHGTCGIRKNPKETWEIVAQKIEKIYWVYIWLVVQCAHGFYCD